MKEAVFYDLVSKSCHACPEPRALRSGGGGKPLTRRLAALAVAAALMAGTAVPAFAEVYDIGAGSITIEANGDGTAKVTQNENVTDKDNDVTVTGSNEVTGNTVDIINNTDNDLKVTLSDVTITDPKGDAAPVSVSGTGNTAIELDGSNTLKSSGWHAGLERNEEKNSDGNVVSGKLTIQDEDKNGSLDATGGFGGAGIGGANIKNSGALEITGGTITATGKQDGAGIGGGGSGGDGTVTISGGNITARGGSSDNPKAICGAGIGGGGGGGNATVTITGDAVIEEATGGGGCAGIGNGYYDSKTDITISGNAEVKNAQGGAQGAGIGGGGFGGTGTVTITDNAKVDNATGGEGAAGIGSGVFGNVTVNISGNATVNAEGGANGAGIGGGYASAGNVTIEGGTTVSAAGGVGGGAGIGGGADLAGDEDTRNRVTIRSNGDGSPDVSAVGGAPEPGQDGEDASKGGAAIGSGALIDPDGDAAEADADITIEGKVTISAIAGKDGVAIGANGKEQAFDDLLPGSSIDRRNADGKDISLPGDKTTEKTPAVESANSGRLDALTGLTVTDAAGKAVAYTLTWQDGTVTVKADAAFASLQMTYDALCWLRSHGMQTMLFCTQERTASVSAVELLGVCTQGTTVVWNNDGASSALRVNGADHSTLLK